MAVLKKIKFGESSNNIAKTIVTAKSGGVMSVAAPDGVQNTLTEDADYQYELDVNVDGTTITKSAAAYYTAEDQEVINGTKQVGDLKTPAGLTVGTVPAANVSVADSDNKFTATDVEAALAELKSDIETVVSDGKTYSIVDDTANVQDLPTNVLKRYRLQQTVGSTNTLVGEPIDILKDNSLLAAKLSTTDATWSGSAIVDGSGDEALVLVYKDANGTAQVIAIDVSDFLKEAEFGDGLAVSNAGAVSAKLGNGLEFGSESAENKSINVKIDSTSEGDSQTTSVPFLSVGAGGVKISGIKDEIDRKIAALDYTDTAVSGQYVSEVDETDGVISVSRANVADAVLTGYTKGNAPAAGSEAVAATDDVKGAIAKLEHQVDAAKSAASAAHSVVAADSDNAHVTVTASQPDSTTGAVTYTIGETNIADADDLADEITRAQNAEGEIAGLVGLSGTEGSRTFTPTTNYGGSGQAAATSVMDNMQKIDTALNTLSTTVGDISYSVSGTELTFYGIPQHS